MDERRDAGDVRGGGAGGGGHRSCLGFCWPSEIKDEVSNVSQSWMGSCRPSIGQVSLHFYFFYFFLFFSFFLLFLFYGLCLCRRWAIDGRRFIPSVPPIWKLIFLFDFSKVRTFEMSVEMGSLRFSAGRQSWNWNLVKQYAADAEHGGINAVV